MIFNYFLKEAHLKNSDKNAKTVEYTKLQTNQILIILRDLVKSNKSFKEGLKLILVIIFHKHF